MMASTSRTTMASSTPAPSSSSSSSGTRSGFFLRQKALSAANKLVAGASALVNNVVDGGVDDDQQRASKPSLYTEERCLVFVSDTRGRLEGNGPCLRAADARESAGSMLTPWHATDASCSRCLASYNSPGSPS